MKLSEWIENKKKELINVNGFKSAELNYINNCQVSAFLTIETFNIGEKIKIDESIEVEDFDRKILGDNKINALEIIFNVIKPRHRKPERYKCFVKPI